MPTLSLLLLLVASSFVSGAGVANEPPLPYDLEVELARSALPSHLRDDATIYVWEAGVGYRVAITGTNGFHTLVGRDDPGIRLAPWTLTEYPDDLLIPVAFDPAGVSTHLQVYLDLGRMRTTGVPAPEAQRRLKEGFASGKYAAPERPGIAYMLSPFLRAYRNTESGQELVTAMTPHYMFYAPDVVPSDVGATGTLNDPVMLNTTPDPHGLIVVLKGESERAAIREGGADMLARLCEIHDAWCLPMR